jgi:hypothetical protein
MQSRHALTVPLMLTLTALYACHVHAACIVALYCIHPDSSAGPPPLKTHRPFEKKRVEYLTYSMRFGCCARRALGCAGTEYDS